MLAGLRQRRCCRTCATSTPPTARIHAWQDASGQSHEVWQSEGGEQGDPLMRAFYAIAQHPALAAVHVQLREGEAVLPTSTTFMSSQFPRTPANGHFASTRALNSTVAKPAARSHPRPARPRVQITASAAWSRALPRLRGPPYL